MLKVEGLSCRYGKVAAVSDLSLEVRRGELVTLIGANGAGKTTTLKAISGLMAPAGGRLAFEGQDITGASARRILQLGIAHCPEGRRVFPYMTVIENLQMGCHLRRDAGAIAADMARFFERFPILYDRRAQTAGTLSGGEQQMLAIARALMSRPKLVLFDEPSLGLAPNIVDRVFEVIKGIQAEGVTIIMVEQNAFAALELSDRSYVIEQGRLKLTGTGAELLSNPEVKAAYLGA
ncbi:amino acid/amide ABC transporter ATP-binding protein 2, HAAT family [Rhizobiales bacterium GAS188]|nr:amino acid/amide ABC transporter ATP-binding protein 2, HAAT family [Rhizobiales bacterium GAS188]